MTKKAEKYAIFFDRTIEIDGELSTDRRLVCYRYAKSPAQAVSRYCWQAGVKAHAYADMSGDDWWSEDYVAEVAE